MLALLAPDRADQQVMLERLERPLPVGWEKQLEQGSVALTGHRRVTGPFCPGQARWLKS
jgi:hypothetical protein